MYVQDKFEFSKGNKSLSWGGGGGGVGGVLQIYFEIDKRLKQVSCWMGDPACTVLCHLNLHVQPSNKTPKILLEGCTCTSNCFESVHIDSFLSSNLVPAGCKKQEHLSNSYRDCSLVVFHLCTLRWK